MLIHTEQQSLVVDERFRGLPDVAHGGYVAGLMAAEFGGEGAEVRLRRPVPLGRNLSLERADHGLVELRDGELLLAEAAPADVSPDVPLPVNLAEAEAASRRFLGCEKHLIPGCLVCGPERRDGLRIFPGPVAGRRLVAAPWIPDAELADESGHVPAELAWAALDCPQLWALIHHVPPGTPDRAVTAAIAARVERPVMAGEPHVVIGWPIGRDGRRLLAGAAVIGPDGELRVVGRQTAALTSWGVPLGRSSWQA